MSYQEIKHYVSLAGTVLIFGTYSSIVFMKYQDAILTSTASPRFWGAVLLILIPVSIVAKIILSIAFTIAYRMAAKEQEPSFTDELDQLIELKASRISYYVFVLGFLLAMGSLTIGWPLSLMFVILICSGFLAEIADGVTQLYLYRRGV